MTETDKAKSDREAKAKTDKDAPYHVSDLPEGAEPDPLGDASLTALERATASSGDK
jgi:hypothetical protein